MGYREGPNSVDIKDAPVSHHGFINFEMAFGAGHSAQGEGLFSILNTFMSIDICSAYNVLI
jgi:hypothetical protein